MTRYAWREITLTILIGGLLTAAVAYYWYWWALLPAAATLALLSFYRDPPRRVPPDANVLVAPADGKVVEITRNLEAEDGAQPMLRIMVFLSVFNVHVNRSPCAGRVTGANHRPGRFINALSSAADAENECNTIEIDPPAPLAGPVRVRQIAGVLARRIVCSVKAGDELATGQRYGMIKLGSRTELCVPESEHWEMCVAVGDAVKGGKTVLARLQSTAGDAAAAGT